MCTRVCPDAILAVRVARRMVCAEVLRSALSGSSKRDWPLSCRHHDFPTPRHRGSRHRQTLREEDGPKQRAPRASRLYKSYRESTGEVFIDRGASSKKGACRVWVLCIPAAPSARVASETVGSHRGHPVHPIQTHVQRPPPYEVIAPVPVVAQAHVGTHACAVDVITATAQPAAWERRVCQCQRKCGYAPASDVQAQACRGRGEVPHRKFWK